MQRAHVWRSVVVATLAAVAFLLAGCTSSGSLPKDYGQAWIDRMQNALRDDQGAGGIGLALVVDGHRAVGAFGTDTVATGSYDVLTVCRSTATVHVTVRSASFHGGRNGKDVDAGTVLDEGDVICGATTRLSVEVPEGEGITIDAVTDDTSGRALWSAQVVRPGWKE